MIGVGTAGPTGGLAGAPSAAPPASGRLSERDGWVVLASVSGLGPVGFGALLRSYGSAREILVAARLPDGIAALVRASRDDDRARFGEAVAAAIGAAARDPGPILEVVRAAAVSVVILDDPGYPARLRAIEMPPQVLFVRGDPAAMAAGHAVAVVGTRRATDDGRRIASRIGVALARAGAAVVSGLAVGIDGAVQAAVAHEGGRTVAVIGSGHGRLYPFAHHRLARTIVDAGGAVVSELFPDSGPTRGTFPRRNRLISGLADATVVVEAGERSGALITAAWALEQGRECFLVPGPIDAPRSAGCLEWLRQYPGQARIVAGIPELVEDLGILGGERSGPSGAPARPSLEAELIEIGATARRIATELLAGRGTVDELVVATGYPVATALGALTLLELRGLAASAYGRYRPAGRLAGADRPPASPEAGARPDR